MNMTKHDLRLLMLHEFKLGHNASEASANINRVEKSPQGIGQYEGGSGNSGVAIRALKMKRVEDVWVVSRTSNCMRLLSKIHVKVLEKCLRQCQHCNSLAPFENYLKGEKAR
ncbi:hypothetical protein FHG87_019218 [Trinorchestia longiramus]|nr:hypothetical protein FHG87_019218 [Trinorchestia longiramus]